jgi:hypothetical protein
VAVLWTIINGSIEQAHPLGTREEVAAVLAETLPGVLLDRAPILDPELLLGPELSKLIEPIDRETWQEPRLEANFEADDFSILFCSIDQPVIDWLNVRVHGEGDPRPILTKICAERGWTVINPEIRSVVDLTSPRIPLANFSVDEDIVSIWAAICPVAEIPDDYFMRKFPREWYEPMNPFCADFGITGYDEDHVEAYCEEDGWPSVDIGQLVRLEWSSYCDTFRDQAIVRANEIGVGKTPYVYAIYNFQYDPTRSGIGESRFMKFVGTFPYKYELPEWIKRMGEPQV